MEHMEEILVSIKCPSISEVYDVYLPQSLHVEMAARLLGEGVEQLSNHRYTASGKELLCMAKDGVLMKQGLLIQDYGIQNGDELSIF